MTAVRHLSELTEDELRELVRAAVRAELGAPKPERAKPVDREPPPESYARVMARRRRRGR